MGTLRRIPTTAAARHRPCSGTPNENKQRHAQPHPPPWLRRSGHPPQTALAADIRSAVNNSERPSSVGRASPRGAQPAEALRRLAPDTLQAALAQSQRQFSLWLAGRTQEDAHNLLRNYYTSMLHDHIDSSAEATVKQCQPQAPSSRLAEQAKHYRAFIIDSAAARFPARRNTSASKPVPACSTTTSGPSAPKPG